MLYLARYDTNLIYYYWLINKTREIDNIIFYIKYNKLYMNSWIKSSILKRVLIIFKMNSKKFTLLLLFVMVTINTCYSELSSSTERNFQFSYKNCGPASDPGWLNYFIKNINIFNKTTYLKILSASKCFKHWTWSVENSW